MTIGWQLEQVGSAFGAGGEVPKESKELRPKGLHYARPSVRGFPAATKPWALKVLFGPPAEEPIKRQPKLSHGPWVMTDEESPDAKDHGTSSVYLQCIPIFLGSMWVSAGGVAESSYRKKSNTNRSPFCNSSK